MRNAIPLDLSAADMALLRAVGKHIGAADHDETANALIRAGLQRRYVDTNPERRASSSVVPFERRTASTNP